MLIAVFVIIVNLFMRWLVPLLQVPFMTTFDPLGACSNFGQCGLQLSQGASINILFLVAIASLSYFMRWYKSAPLWTYILIGAVASNVVEKVLFSSVRDYIPLGFAVFNLADLQIVFSLMMISIINAKSLANTGSQEGK